MDIVALIERIGEAPTAALFGLITGIIFGVAAQRSNFCLRAATVEFARGKLGPKVSVWLLTFSTAVVWVQGAQMLGLFRAADSRVMSVPGSWSGAIIGGLLFGAGMVMARGCSGRLLVLASTGNLRSVVSGLIFAVVAQMSLKGILAPFRDKLAGLWITGAENVSVLDLLRIPDWSGFAFGLAVAVLALYLSVRNGIGPKILIFASGVGFAVAVGWVLTWQLAQVAFEPVAVTSATFSGPSANTLMFFLDRNAVFEFDVGLVPGVVLGALISSVLTREFSWQAFDSVPVMRRSMIGAVLMGFGAMLAGGCAIGNGVTGGSVFAGTAWLALFCMWIGAVVTDFLLDQRAPAAQTA
ncbi:YeeE/YedE family protein [Sedimentimonas flavescens]|uniref:YeeE/YedE family protein n=1 Tax=Sedimentimonas flavescens TaxID=2851012 RepID=A0ABT2ZUA1_9RHOB|nr:YeeE/YedE family protein [Sedimentimonas flavescens]MBW0156900.1 YeeE/YedE family protein [Sedimentimonas flavescens]MCT2539392.1 YeeE/YedE family protein [Sedimentimonas flavescens]MCV2877328.1 YeeE/YedE family protein [Sedimentimonas flavescens]